MKFNIILIIMVSILFFVTGCSSKSNQNQDIPKEKDTINTQEKSNQQVVNEEIDKSDPSPYPKKENTNAEEYILKLFNGSYTIPENRRNIISAIKYINWIEYNRISHGKAMDLLLWLDSIEITESKEIICILKATTGLDGVFAEQYAIIITRNLYLKDMVKFIKCLAKLETEKKKEICFLIAYNCGYFIKEEYKKVVDDTIKLLNLPNLSPKEKETAKEIIKSLETNGSKIRM